MLTRIRSVQMEAWAVLVLDPSEALLANIRFKEISATRQPCLRVF